jgi:hypothetical protein
MRIILPIIVVSGAIQVVGTAAILAYIGGRAALQALGLL